MKTMNPLHIVTPLRESVPLSNVAGTSVYLKLDSCQPTGGNAGMATAYSARKLGVPATIVVPSVTPSGTVQKLNDEGADVIIHGKSLNESIEYGKQLVSDNSGWVFISPFDDPLIWEGHTSLVKELESQLDEKPGVVVLSVGGGGLLNGVIEGLHRAEWEDVPIIAMETVGAHSLNEAMKVGQLVTLPDITSVATTLGLKQVSSQTMKLVGEHTVYSELVTDQEAVWALERFIMMRRFWSNLLVVLLLEQFTATSSAVYRRSTSWLRS